MTMDGWRQALTSLLEGIPQDVTLKAIRQVFNAGIKARQPVQVVSPHTQLIDLWCKAFEDAFRDKYVFLAKDATAVKRLLAIDYGPKVADPVAHVMKIATTAWDYRDTYPCSMSFTLPKLLSHINEIREWLNANRNGKLKVMMPAFKQVDILRQMLADHPQNPRSIGYNPDAGNKAEYLDIKRKLAALEQEQRKQVLG